MPLNPAQLQTDLLSLFRDPPDSFEGCAAAWADATTNYLSGMLQLSTVPDLSFSNTFLRSALQAAFESGAAIEPMETAFRTTALQVSLQIVSTGTYVSVPPPGNVGFATLFGSTAATHETATAAFSIAIDTWARTGSTTLIATPFTTLPWT